MTSVTQTPPAPIDLMDRVEDQGSEGQLLSPAMPTDLGTDLTNPTPTAAPSATAAGGLFADFDTSTEPQSLSPCPSPTPELRSMSPLVGNAPPPSPLDGGLDSLSAINNNPFGVDLDGPTLGGPASAPGGPMMAHTGLGGPPVATMNYGGSQMSGGMPVVGGSQYYNQGTLPMAIPPMGGSRAMAKGTPYTLGAPAPGSPSLGMGVGGSPVRIMTRGGKSVLGSLSSSPSGPGLEDAVKALGLKGSPAKTAKTKDETPRSVSPNLPPMGSGYMLAEEINEGEGQGEGHGQHPEEVGVSEEHSIAGTGMSVVGSIHRNLCPGVSHLFPYLY